MVLEDVMLNGLSFARYSGFSRDVDARVNDGI